MSRKNCDACKRGVFDARHTCWQTRAEYIEACGGQCPVCDHRLNERGECVRCDDREYQDSLEHAYGDDSAFDAGGL